MKAVKGKRCHLSLSYLKKIIQLNRKQFHFQALSSKTKGLLAVKQLNSTQLSNLIQSSASHPVSSDNGVGEEHDDSLYNTGLPLTRAVTSTRLECTEQVDEIFDSANPKSCPSQQSILKGTVEELKYTQSISLHPHAAFSSARLVLFGGRRSHRGSH